MYSRQSARPILMTVDPIGGVWSYALELCRGLAHSDIAVSLAVMGRRLTPTERAAARAVTAEVFESDFKLEWMEDPWDDVERAGDWLLDLESRIQPSLVHLNGYAHGALRWRVPCLIVGHSCVYSWFEAVRHEAAGEEWRRYRQAVSVGLRGADLVTAPSQFMLAQLKKYYGNFAAVSPIYNGRSAAQFAPLAKQPFILTVGRLWDPAKNIAGLAPAAAKLSWSIYAAGAAQGPDGRAIDADGLQLLGELDSATLARWYGRAAVFALPARYEPFGLSILEAALAGCALVLGDIPSLREIWREAALFVKPDDPDEIASVLAKLLVDSAIRTKMANRALARALEFTPERMTEAYLALYERLLSAGAQSVSDNLTSAAAEKWSAS